MGVSEIWKLVAPAEEIKSLSQFSLDNVKIQGPESSPVVDELPRIGVDMGTYFDECVAVTRSSGLHIAAGSGPLRPLFFRLCQLLKVPAIFVFVFDGPNRPATKRGVRVNLKPLWWEDVSKRLIRCFGFIVHQAPGEAEAELAMLNRWGVVDAVYTKDGDALVFGASVVLKSLTHDERGGTDNVKHLSASGVAEKTGFTQGRLLLYALAAGGDYDVGISHCGRIHASSLALSGIGDTLFLQMKAARSKEEQEIVLRDWRKSAREAIENKSVHFHTALQKRLLAELENFPLLEVVSSYVNPATSLTFQDYEPNTWGWKTLEPPNPRAIIDFCRTHLAWSDTSALLKVLRSNLWEGLVLRQIYSRVCGWTRSTQSFGTPTCELGVQWCRLKKRRAKAVAGRVQGRLRVQESDLMAAVVGEGIFEAVDLGEEVVEVWVPSKMLPDWAVRVGEGSKGKMKAKQKEVVTASKGKARAPASFSPTGNILQDLEQLEHGLYEHSGESREVEPREVIDLTNVDAGGDQWERQGDRGEGPSKRRKISEGDVIDLTV